MAERDVSRELLLLKCRLECKASPEEEGFNRVMLRFCVKFIIRIHSVFFSVLFVFFVYGAFDLCLLLSCMGQVALPSSWSS